MPNITSAIDRTASTTRVDPRVASPMTPMTASGQLQAIIDATKPTAERAPIFRQPAPRGGSGRATTRPGQQRTTSEGLTSQEAARRQGAAAGASEVARMAALDRYEMQRRNAAKRPVTGPNMIGGMIEDPTRLPSRYRAQSSSFGESGPKMASAGDDVRAGQAEEQQLAQNQLGLDRQRMLLKAIEDARFAQEGIG